jgi:hypothetical protein
MPISELTRNPLESGQRKHSLAEKGNPENAKRPRKVIYHRIFGSDCFLVMVPCLNCEYFQFHPKCTIHKYHKRNVDKNRMRMET